LFRIVSNLKSRISIRQSHRQRLHIPSRLHSPIA
jgi:hypothetical protein